MEISEKHKEHIERIEAAKKGFENIKTPDGTETDEELAALLAAYSNQYDILNAAVADLRHSIATFGP